jgi:hypothetical protein
MADRIVVMKEGKVVETAEAHALFAIAWWQGSVGEKLPRWALEPLRDAARAGNDRAIAVYATATALKKGKPHRDAVAMLEAAVRERRSPPAAFLLALHAIDLHADPARTIELLRIAAETGYEGAYTLLAATLERDAPQLAEEAQRWRLESARAGSAESARKVADWYAEGTPARDARLAQLWYVEAVRHEDMVAALSLAKLLLSEPKGVVGGLRLKDGKGAIVFAHLVRNDAIAMRTPVKLTPAKDLTLLTGIKQITTEANLTSNEIVAIVIPASGQARIVAASDQLVAGSGR